MKKIVLMVSIGFLCTHLAIGQKADTLIKRLDSLHTQKDSSGGRQINTNATAYNERTKITVPVYFILLGTDFTQEVTGPFHSSQKTWSKVAGFAILEGGMFLLDKPVQRFASDFMDRHSGYKGISHGITNFGAIYEGYTLAAIGIYGWAFKNQKMKTTTLLATQSYLVAGAMESILKVLTGRQRPNYLEAGRTEPRPLFHGPFYFPVKTSTSFPSGHTTAAFAAATVYALEYRNLPWVPIVSYSAATLIGLSRITENKHWISDVFAGAALGYITGLQVVRNYHRYAYLQNHKTPVKSISLSMQYNYDHVEPALLLTLR
jgi:membrane-associated phospholipid phosphatase